MQKKNNCRVRRNVISLYLDAETIEIIQPQLSDFTIKKDALYLPYSKELPVSAIENAVKVYFETE